MVCRSCLSKELECPNRRGSAGAWRSARFPQPARIARVEIAEAIFPILVLLALGIAAAVLSRMAKVSPIVGYLFLGIVVSAVRPELLSAGGTVHLLAELDVVFMLDRKSTRLTPSH